MNHRLSSQELRPLSWRLLRLTKLIRLFIVASGLKPRDDEQSGTQGDEVDPGGGNNAGPGRRPILGFVHQPCHAVVIRDVVQRREEQTHMPWLSRIRPRSRHPTMRRGNAFESGLDKVKPGSLDYKVL